MSRDIPEPAPTRPSRVIPPACEACARPATFHYRWPTHESRTHVCDEHMQAVVSHAAARMLDIIALDGGRVEAYLDHGEEAWRVVR